MPDVSGMVRHISHSARRGHYTKVQAYESVTLSFSTALVWDINNVPGAAVNLSGTAAVVLSITGVPMDHGSYEMVIVQGTSNTAMTFPTTIMRFAGGNAQTLSTASGAIDLLQAVGYNGGMLCALTKNYALLT